MNKLQRMLSGSLIVLAGCSPEARNFSQENAKVLDHDISTNGTVVMIDREKSTVNDSTLNDDGSVTYKGMLRYCIKSGPISNDPEYFCDRRYGEVTVKGDEK